MLARQGLGKALVSLVGLAFLCGWFLLWHRWKKPTLQADTFGLLGTALYGASLVFNKDISNTAWLATLPLLVLFIGGPGAGLRWLVITGATTIFGAWLVTSGRAPQAIVPVTWDDIFTRYITLLLVVPAIGLLWDLSVRSTMADLARASEQAQAATKEKVRFLANVSHELRTPLHGLLGMSELLKTDRLPPEAFERVALIQESGQLLTQLIDDLLDVTRAEAGQLRLTKKPTNLEEVVTQACAIHRPIASARGLSFELVLSGETSCLVDTDPRRFVQVVHNLVGNAVKFTPNGSVQVFLTADRSGNDLRVTLEVQDTGSGISKADQAKLFQPFSRINEEAGVAGTGLGLSITRAIVEKLGGHITLASEPGAGSRFGMTVKLPLVSEPSAMLPLQPLASNVVALPRKLRVLVVDDNAINRKVAVAQLEKLDVIVVTAEDGSRALAVMMREPLDLVLMDRHMPELDGLETTRRWREFEKQKGGHLRIVAVTASVLAEDVEACRAAGMDEVLSKPLSFGRLETLIRATAAPRARLMA